LVYRGGNCNFKHDCFPSNSSILTIFMEKNLIHSKYSIIVLLVILVFVIIALGKESYRHYMVSREINDLEKKIEELKKSNEELALTKEYFQSQKFLEEEARKKLNLVKVGEKLIIIASEQENEMKELIQQEEKTIPNIIRWWEYFFGKHG